MCYRSPVADFGFQMLCQRLRRLSPQALIALPVFRLKVITATGVGQGAPPRSLGKEKIWHWAQ